MKSKRCNTAGLFPLKRNGCTFRESRAKADILNSQFCSVFTRDNVPMLEESNHPDNPEIMVRQNGVFKLLV